MSSAGSRRVWSRCAATCSAANRPASHRSSTPTCSGRRFLLLRRPDRLDDAQRAQLDGLFESHPRLGAAWEALGELHGLYLADDKAGALAALDRFTDLYQTGDLPEFYKIVNTLLAAHAPASSPGTPPGEPSNGRIEGTNNLLQVLRRTAHGFTNPHNFAARALLVT